MTPLEENKLTEVVRALEAVMPRIWPPALIDTWTVSAQGRADVIVGLGSPWEAVMAPQAEGRLRGKWRAAHPARAFYVIDTPRWTLVVVEGLHDDDPLAWPPATIPWSGDGWVTIDVRALAGRG